VIRAFIFQESQIPESARIVYYTLIAHLRPAAMDIKAVDKLVEGLAGANDVLKAPSHLALLRLSRSYTERANSAVSTKLSSTFSQLM
jgi:hypothetical protein